MPRTVKESAGWVGGAWGVQRRGLVSLILPPQVQEWTDRRERQQQPRDAPRRRLGNAPAVRSPTQTRAGNEAAAKASFWTISPIASGRQARHPERTATWSHQAEDASAEGRARTKRSLHHGPRAHAGDETRARGEPEAMTRTQAARNREPCRAQRLRLAGGQPRQRFPPRQRAIPGSDRPDFRRAGHVDEAAGAGKRAAAAAAEQGAGAAEATRMGTTTTTTRATTEAQQLREAVAHLRTTTRRRRARRQARRMIGSATRGTGNATTSRFGPGTC